MSKRADIEIISLMREAEFLWPLLSEEERAEKRKEFSWRFGAVLVRETEALKTETAAMDAV